LQDLSFAYFDQMSGKVEGGEYFCFEENLLRTYRLQPKGLILVGVNREVRPGRLLELGFERILIIEAQPALLPSIAAGISEFPQVRLVHAAVSDAAGSTRGLDVTGAELRAPVATLEQILEVNGWSFDSYNVLLVNTPDSHQSILQGAGRVFSHLDLVLLKTAQSREAGGGDGGCGLEEFCQAGGLACAGEEGDASGAQWRVSYVRRPVVTMSTLGRNGRFANQLFQYLFLRLVAEKQNAVVQVPAWFGEEVFGCGGARLLRPPPRLAMESQSEMVPGSVALGDPAELIEWCDPDFRSTDFWGYFQLHTSCLRPHRGLIRNLFLRRERYAAAEALVFGKLRAGGKRVVAVHLRRGDYGYDAFFRAPCAWYERWVEAEGLDAGGHLIFVCSEDAEHYAGRFKGYEVVTSAGYAEELGLERWLLEFLVLCNSDVLAVSNSTFSFFASLLNCNASRFARPRLEAGGLVSFDPWDAEPFLTAKHPPAVHLRLAEQD
jgi:hypothetical protein